MQATSPRSQPASPRRGVFITETHDVDDEVVQLLPKKLSLNVGVQAARDHFLQLIDSSSPSPKQSNLQKWNQLKRQQSLHVVPEPADLDREQLRQLSRSYAASRALDGGDAHDADVTEKNTDSKRPLDAQYHLELLERVWLKWGHGERRGLNSKEFVEFISVVLDLPEHSVKLLFEKMDANSDEEISWDEYLSFLLSEAGNNWQYRAAKGAWVLRNLEEEGAEAVEIPGGGVCQILQVPGDSLFNTPPVYALACKDGSVHIVNTNTLQIDSELPVGPNYMQNTQRNTYHVSKPKGPAPKRPDGSQSARSAPGAAALRTMIAARTVAPARGNSTARPASTSHLLVSVEDQIKATARLYNTASFVMPQAALTCHSRARQIVVAGIDKSVQFFGQQTGVFQPVERKRFTTLRTPSCMTVSACDAGAMHLSDTAPSKEFLFIGDESGCVNLYDANEGGSFDPELSQSPLITSYPVHSDSVRAMAHLPQTGLFSVGMDAQMFVTDAETGARKAQLSGHKLGIFSFAYSPWYKCLVSISYDRSVLIWDLHMPRPTDSLPLNLANVVEVLCNEDRNQIITVAADKKIKIFDIRTYREIQTLTDGFTHHPYDELSAASFDVVKQQLITAGSKLRVWPVEEEPLNRARVGGAAHRTGVIAIMYSPAFNQVVSVGHDGTVASWSLYTGKISFEFKADHGSALTAARLDFREKRLLTGAHNGTVRLWNYSNGDMLADFTPMKGEATDIMLLPRTLYPVVGLSANGFNIYRWMEANYAKGARREDEVRMFEQKGHKASINALDCFEHSHGCWIATGDSSGEVLLWNADSGSCFNRFTVPEKKYVDPNTTAKPSTGARFRRASAASFKERSDQSAPVTPKAFGGNSHSPIGVTFLKFVTLPPQQQQQQEQEQAESPSQHPLSGGLKNKPLPTLPLLLIGTSNGSIHIVVPRMRGVYLLYSYHRVVKESVRAIAVDMPVQDGNRKFTQDPCLTRLLVCDSEIDTKLYDITKLRLFERAWGSVKIPSGHDSHSIGDPFSHRPARSATRERVARRGSTSNLSLSTQEPLHSPHSIDEVNGPFTERSSGGDVASSVSMGRTEQLHLTGDLGAPAGPETDFKLVRQWSPHRLSSTTMAACVRDPVFPRGAFLTSSDSGHVTLWSYNAEFVAAFDTSKGPNFVWPVKAPIDAPDAVDTAGLSKTSSHKGPFSRALSVASEARVQRISESQSRLHRQPHLPADDFAALPNTSADKAISNERIQTIAEVGGDAAVQRVLHQKGTEVLALSPPRPVRGSLAQHHRTHSKESIFPPIGGSNGAGGQSKRGTRPDDAMQIALRMAAEFPSRSQQRAANALAHADVAEKGDAPSAEQFLLECPVIVPKTLRENGLRRKHLDLSSIMQENERMKEDLLFEQKMALRKTTLYEKLLKKEAEVAAAQLQKRREQARQRDAQQQPQTRKDRGSQHPGVRRATTIVGTTSTKPPILSPPLDSTSLVSSPSPLHLNSTSQLAPLDEFSPRGSFSTDLSPRDRNSQDAPTPSMPKAPALKTRSSRQGSHRDSNRDSQRSTDSKASRSSFSGTPASLVAVSKLAQSVPRLKLRLQPPGVRRTALAPGSDDTDYNPDGPPSDREDGG